jgi:hypothetical protein
MLALANDYEDGAVGPPRNSMESGAEIFTGSGFSTSEDPMHPPLFKKRGFILFTDCSSTKLLAHEDAVIAGLGAASRLFIAD